jgi:tRNA A-37 threonylcarbamoyl transferase component Bud32
MNPDNTFIQRISDSGAAELAWSGLTPDLLEKARRRLKTLGWLMLGMMGLGAVVDLSYAALVMGVADPIWTVISVATLLLSAGLVLVARDKRIAHLTVLHLGLAYEVLLCMVMAVITPWLTFIEIGDVPYVTWVTPLIILFPLIVPSPPRTTLVVAIVAAATRPLALLLLELTGRIDIQGVRYVASIFSPAFAVVMAYVGSRVVHGMNVDLAKARRLGSYKLESRLGSGGMGEVWRAAHQFLARPAAVKLIRPETIHHDPETQHTMIARFEREAQATAALCSPHTIQVYDFGVERGGAFYYVMELLNGLDLDGLVRRFGGLSPSRTVHLLLQICDSLGEAHASELIHRDVKPANVYVCRYGRRYDFVKLLDFGLVKFHEQEGAGDLQLTADNTVGGTPGFIAPEQVVGDEVDGRTDIYSLGCVAYWMLTGKYVFEGRTSWEVMMMHVQVAPARLSTRTTQPIPGDLEDVVMSCLRKDPVERPQDVDQLAETLSGCRGGQTWTQEDAHRWWAEHMAAL